MEEKVFNWSDLKQEYILSYEEVKRELESSDSNYLFKDQIKNISEKIFNDDITSNANKVFSIVGERGSGKSSCLSTLVEYLRGESQEEGCYVLDIIDPNIFDSRVRILELFLNQINNEAQKKIRNNQEFDRMVEFNKLIEKTLDTLNRVYIKKEDLVKNTSTGNVLEETKDIVNLEKTIDKLIKSFLDLVSVGRSKPCNKIVLCIDDLDLIANDIIAQTIDDIEKYLANKVYVILTYRDIQLHNALLDKTIIDNNNLIQHQVVDIDEMNEQVMRKLEKLIPTTQRVSLNMDLMNISLKKILYPLEQQVSISNDNSQKLEAIKKYKKTYLREYLITVYSTGDPKFSGYDEYMIDIIAKATRMKIKPIDSNENTYHVYPRTMRSAIQTLEFLESFIVLEEVSDFPTQVELQKLYILMNQNLLKYREWVMSTMVTRLNRNDIEFFKQWESISVENKNIFACKYMMNQIKDNNENNDILVNSELLNVWDVYNENVNIGDLYEVCECYKKAVLMNNESSYFVYLIKIIYSIFLLNNLLCYFSVSLEKNVDSCQYLDDYLKLINGSFMSVITYFDTFRYGKVPSNSSTTREEESKELKEEEELELFKNIMVSSISYSANSSSIWSYARPILSSDNSVSRNYAAKNGYKFRNTFETNTRDIELINGRAYVYNLFSKLVKEEYFKFDKNDKDFIKKYYFYSLFDIDIYTRSILRDKSKDYLESSLNYINRLITGNDEGLGKVMKNLITMLSFNNIVLQDFSDTKLYTDKEIKFFKDHIALFTENGIKLNYNSLSEAVRNNKREHVISLTDEKKKEYIRSYINRIDEIEDYETVSDLSWARNHLVEKYKKLPKQYRIDTNFIKTLCALDEFFELR